MGAYPEQRRQEPVEDLPAWYEEVRRTINPIRRAYQLFVLYTGLRRTDAATIRWEDVDWSAGTLHRPEPKGGKGRAFTIPLSRRAMAILRYLRIAGRKIHPGEPWVFPTRKLNGSIGPLSEPKEQRLINGRKVNRLPSPHRLRDTYVTACAEVGLHDFDIKVLVNHRLPGGDVTAGYVRQNSDHLRQCQERVAKHLSEKLRDRR